MPPAAVECLTKRLALCAYVALLALVVGWETWAAPLTPVPRAFWLIIKTPPLLIPLPGLLRGSPRAFVLAALLVLLYFCEGVATAYSAAQSGDGAALAYAVAEIFISLIFIATAPLYARFRWRRGNLQAPAGTES